MLPLGPSLGVEALDVAPDPAIAVAGVVAIAVLFGIVAVGCAVLLSIKRNLINACPIGLRFHPAEPEMFEGLDANALARYSADLGGMGFVELSSYTISVDQGTVQPGFARLFGQLDLECFAEVNQLFPTGQSVPMRVVLATRFSDGWTAATTDREADAAVWLLRRPRACWRSAPAEGVASLLELHRDLCSRIVRETGARPEAPVTADCWYDAERRSAVTVRETLVRRSIVVVLWEFFTYRGRSEWLGSLKSARSNARNDYN